MCGIAGILRWGDTRPEHSEIEQMTRQLSHRGPDGEGFLVQDGVALGHRRLAIIDPATGQQPLCNEDQGVWVTYNGELYNFRELTQELIQMGHQFRTHSDTEVVVHAYEEWGLECFSRFRGMFAFGLVDFKKHRLVLARDHFGIKPLVYRLGHDYFAFASELTALRMVNDAPPTGNLLALDYYLRFQYIPTPHTIYQTVYKLPPASYLVIDFEGHIQGPIRYWDGHFAPKGDLTDEEWLERTRAVIAESVRAHLVADVPFGVFLSGGIDSTLVTLEMSRLLDRPVQAFAIGFSEPAYSELSYAEDSARHCGVDLHTEIVSVHSLDMLPDLVAHYGEPFGDSSAIPTWHVSRLARSQVPMVLSGDGGDEGFAGYQSYKDWMQNDPWTNAKRVMQESPLRGIQAMFRTSLRYLRQRTFNDLDDWQRRILYLTKPARRQFWRAEFQHLISRPAEVFEEADRTAHHWDRQSYAQYLDYQTYLPCDILTKVDIASMYHGLEVRPPLIDLRVFELIASLPIQQRIHKNGSKTWIGKHLLKQALIREHFAEDFVHRPKQGFALPRALWFQPGKPGRALLEDVLLHDPDERLQQWFHSAQIAAAINLHSDNCDNSGILWLFLVLGIWLQQNPEIEFR